MPSQKKMILDTNKNEGTPQISDMEDEIKNNESIRYTKHILLNRIFLYITPNHIERLWPDIKKIL
jgi:hypothetical protein